MTEPTLPDRFFSRDDESPDSKFYELPRFTTHIDNATITALTNYYREVLEPTWRILDLMSSWISHLPAEVRYRHVTGHGMNEKELARNPRLDDYWVQDLNDNPVLPYPNESFEAVLIAVSIQYLTQPFEVFDEIARVLSPGGCCIVSMSHRLFPTKAIYAFKVLPPVERCQIVASYMEHTGRFETIDFIDRSPRNADPLWIVHATRGNERK
jgi:SAM-dependent methyltransferase